MQEAGIIFPNQLFEDSPLITKNLPLYLVEEYLFFHQYAFHKQKMAYHRATMKFYESFLTTKGLKVAYIEAQERHADVRQLIQMLAEKGVSVIHVVDPVDDWLNQQMEKVCSSYEITIRKYNTPQFINTFEEIRDFFRPDKKKYTQSAFYSWQRKKQGILVDSTGKPTGGKWSFDSDNRKKYPKNKVPPAISYPSGDSFYKEAVTYVRQHYEGNPGVLRDTPLYPTNFSSTREWLQQFLDHRFAEFGPYEDAIVAHEMVLNHSVMTPMLNTGLITPDKILSATLEHAEREHIPLNSMEGFIRQILGWREFIRGIYEAKGRQQRTTNFWDFRRTIPDSFYRGTTGILPVDNTIQKVLKTGYSHHIERLMILGNFMLLCEFHPDEVYRWFMELFIDAYDWVMVPNVYGMTQFADGGLMASKPYISGSNYLMKMSNYPKGEWQKTWNALFWRFMHVHRDLFTKNPRLGMLIKNFDKKPQEQQQQLLDTANHYLSELDRK